MGPPSSGGVAVAQILGQLAHYDLAGMRPMSGRALHLLIEASRRAFADRNRYVADPGFAKAPLRQMLDPAYLRRRARTIDPAKAGPRAAPGRFPQRKGALPGAGRSLEIPATSHISIVDGDGDAISMTTTIEAGFGSGIMVYGFLLNNELTDFSFRARRRGQPVANRVQGGKRPRSSMAPTMVFDRRGRLVLVTGSPGGSRIIGYVAQSVVAVLDWRMSAQAAAGLPHVLSRNGPAEVERRAPQALVEGLRALGHRIRRAHMVSGLHIIRRLPDGRLEGGADPRREGIALGD
jgi:gamma-glutamyltranspeptidase/glutathione hydrolase